MKPLALTTALALSTLSSAAWAQQPRTIEPASRTTSTELRLLSPGEVQATPEMWFYEQELRRYDDPKTALRANAEYKAAQRRARIAAMNWYGYSNSRPQAGIDVVHGNYSPGWVSNSYAPFQWIGPNNSAVIWPVPSRARGY